jgi:hypothetical protein
MVYTRWTLGGISIGFVPPPKGNFFLETALPRSVNFVSTFGWVVAASSLSDMLSDRRALDDLATDAITSFFALVFSTSAGVTTLEETLRLVGVRGDLLSEGAITSSSRCERFVGVAIVDVGRVRLRSVF